MGSFWDANYGYQYVSASYQLSNTHGAGGAELHKLEIEQICNEIVDIKLQQILPQFEQEIRYRTINSLLEALKVDINSIVTIAMNNAGDIFYGEHAQTAIMQAIYNEILNNLQTNITISM